MTCLITNLNVGGLGFRGQLEGVKFSEILLSTKRKYACNVLNTYMYSLSLDIYAAHSDDF